MYNDALEKTFDRKKGKTYFLQLINGNKELSEIEKQFCREKFIYLFELNNIIRKLGEQRECDNCKTIRYSDKYCEWCISLHLQSLFNTWTSGNKIIDNF